MLAIPERRTATPPLDSARSAPEPTRDLAFPSAFPSAASAHASRLATPYVTPDAEAFNALLLPKKKDGDDSDFEDDYDLDAVPPSNAENAEPSCVAYAAAIAAEGGLAQRCSQWHRACLSHAIEVSISHYGLRPRGGKMLAPSLADNAHVRSLDLSDNGLGAEGVSAIVTALCRTGRQPAAPALRALSLRQNQAGVDGAEAVATLLRSSHPLECLDFAANAIGNKGMGVLAQAIAGAKCKLRMLCIERNELEDEGMEQLATALGENYSLTSLSLEWNAIGPVGGKALAVVLPMHGTLRALNLGWNGLGDQGIAVLADALAKAPASSPPTLVDLRLHHNRATVLAALPLSRALRTLEMLDVSGNPLGAGGAATLLLAQQEQNSRAKASGGKGGGGAQYGAERCRVIMEDCCVRPDTPLAGLLRRAADAEEISSDDLQQSGVYAAAAAAAGKENRSKASRPTSKESKSKGIAIRAEVRPEIGPPTSQVKSGKKK